MINFKNKSNNGRTAVIGFMLLIYLTALVVNLLHVKSDIFISTLVISIIFGTVSIRVFLMSLFDTDLFLGIELGKLL